MREQRLRTTGECRIEPRAAMSGLRACNGAGLRDGSGGTRRAGAAACRRRPAAARAAGGEAMPLVADWQRLCHDLRTPLNAILGNAELLLDGSAGPLSGEARACLGDIQLAGQRLMRHVGSLLALHRARATPPLAGETPVDLVELLRQAPVVGPADAPEVMIEGLPGAARCVVRAIPAGSRCSRQRWSSCTSTAAPAAARCGSRPGLAGRAACLPAAILG